MLRVVSKKSADRILRNFGFRMSDFGLPPRDPTAWLIMVGRNFGVDQARHNSRNQALPDESVLSDLYDVQEALVERLDNSQYREILITHRKNSRFSNPKS